MSQAYTLPEGLTGLVIVASTRAARGIYQDRSGPLAVEWLRSQGFATPEAQVVADADFPAYFTELVTTGQLPSFLLTSGGTGLNSDDVTVEAVRLHLDKEVPGLMHAFWAQGLKNTPAAVLSRGVAGTIGRSFIMTLPGSTGGVADGCAVLQPLVPHIFRQLEDYHDH